MAIPASLEFSPLDEMVDSVKDTLLDAFRQLMRPLVRILLRHGISYPEYAEIAKIVFTEVADKDFRIPGKRQTQSRIAILTGLTRKEVSRILRAIHDSVLPSTENLNRIDRVLIGWHQDPDFTGPHGLPLQLSFQGSNSKFLRIG